MTFRRWGWKSTSKQNKILLSFCCPESHVSPMTGGEPESHVSPMTGGDLKSHVNPMTGGDPESHMSPMTRGEPESHVHPVTGGNRRQAPFSSQSVSTHTTWG